MQPSLRNYITRTSDSLTSIGVRFKNLPSNTLGRLIAQAMAWFRVSRTVETATVNPSQITDVTAAIRFHA